MKKKRIIVGLSGGVDSSVTALLLQQQGHQVEGLFMKNWEDDDNEDYCAAEEDFKDAKAVAELLEIPLHKVNFAKKYWDYVFAYFLQEYQAHRTPNPDVLCNKEIKFKAFLDYALNLGADYIATGHYARIKQENNLFYLQKGLDENKDQSYFLYLLNQKALRYSLFPIGELEKTKVREIALHNNLPTHAKKDSTGVCFIGEKHFTEFLQKYLPAQPGEIQDLSGNSLGTHIGLMYYTIGQRQGLGIGGVKDSNNGAWFVVDKNIKNNILLVAQGKDHPSLFANVLLASQQHWITQIPQFPLYCQAKIRYRQTQQACKVEKDKTNLIVSFTHPQRAITPGQSIVFYQQEICLGGAIIETIIKDSYET